jgi:hypothetical protein
MAYVFHRRLALPLWAIAFCVVALTAPPPTALFLMPPSTLFAITVAGMAVVAGIVFAMPDAIPWLRKSRSLARVRPSRQRDGASAGLTMAAGTCVRTLDEPNRMTADALDLVRMDDDGGWQMTRPSA